jgi:hypothetical protein
LPGEDGRPRPSGERSSAGTSQCTRNTPRLGSEQSNAETARAASSERSTKNHRFQRPNRERRVNRPDCIDEQRHHQAPAPKGATDNSLGRMSWVSRKRRSGPAKMLIEPCTTRPKQCNSPYNPSPLKGEVVENRSTKRVSAQSLL